MSIVYENDLFRIRRLPKEIKSEVEMTDEMADRIAERLMRGRTRKANRLVLPTEVLAAVGVTSTAELTASVEDGRIVLTPTAAAESDACAP